MRTIETEAFEVIEHEISLSCLVKHEFDDLGTVLAGPVLGDLRDTLNAHAAFLLLNGEVLVGGSAEHKLHFRIQFGL